MIRTLPRTTLSVALWLLLLFVVKLSAQQPDSSAARSLRTFLNADGTLNLSTGFQGSLDARGWNLFSGPDGAPRFVRSEKDETDLAALTEGDDGWDDRFGPPGTSGTVYAVAVSGENVYIGGRFATAGRLLASNVACWNAGTGQWSVLGTERNNGVGGPVFSLAADGDDVYVGGAFESTGTIPAFGIARWNRIENRWYPLGGGTERTMPCAASVIRRGDVLAIVVIGDDVYVGGGFGIPYQNLAVWSKSAEKWRSVGSPRGVDNAPGEERLGSVRALAVQGSSLIVAGYFKNIDGMPARHIARYDLAARSWSALGAGLDSAVHSLAVVGSDLYAGGRFVNAGDVPAKHIALWKDGAWSQVGGGVDAPVWSLVADGSDLWVGGEFMIAGTHGANGIAKWNGAAWAVLDIGIGASSNGVTRYDRPHTLGNCWQTDAEIVTLKTPHVTSIGIVGGDILAGGHFSTAGSTTARNIAKWDGDRWHSLVGSGTVPENHNGVDGAVFAVAIDGENIYVGGDFTKAGGVEARYVARWNTRTSMWSPLGSGIGGSSPFVRVIAVSNGLVYVGGSFTSAGGVPANNIAAWNGSVWSALGSGVGGAAPYVFAIVPRGSDLWVGGSFTSAGGTPANRVARWSGGVWSALGAGIAGDSSEYAYVTSLAVNGNDLYAGGEFQRAGGSRASRLAKWNGNAWSEVGGGTNATVSAVAAIGENLYIGGDFTRVGGVAVSRIAAWNGSEWKSLGRGASAAVRSLTAGPNGELYVGGEFTRIDSILPASRIARWDGSTWAILGPDTAAGTNGPIHALAVGGGMVYAGGAFSVAGAYAANNVGVWDGRSWSSLGSDPSAGLYGIVTAIAVRGTDVYVGGHFHAVGGMRAGSVAKWDGQGWSRLGTGVNGVARTMAIATSGDLYVGGEFDTVGSVRSPGIGRWDGATWHTVGGGVGGARPYVFALAASGNDIYVGGSFSTAGEIDAFRVARWSGGAWSGLGDGIGGSSFYTYVTAIAARGNDVWVGGSFPGVESIPTSNVAHWNGSSWSALDGGVDGQVYALAVDERGDLYVGGEFGTAGAVSAANIARWSGGEWSRLAEGTSSPVFAITTANDEVYVGGAFASAGNVVCNRIGAWNGAKWFSFGSGVSGDFEGGNVVAVAVVGKRIHVGGDFTVAGGKPSFYFGIWDRTSVSVPDMLAPAAASISYIESTPNPAAAETTIRFRLDGRETIDLVLCDLRGDVVRSIHHGMLDAGDHAIRADVGGLAEGVYIYRLRAGERMVAGKLVVRK